MFGRNKEEEKGVSKMFVNVLAIISILGFAGIVGRTLFDFNIENYIESIWFLIMGLGFVFESSPVHLLFTIRQKLGERNFSSLTTLVVGLLALAAGVFSLPYFGFSNPGFYAMQGVISVIAILFIAVEAWVLK